METERMRRSAAISGSSLPVMRLRNQTAPIATKKAITPAKRTEVRRYFANEFPQNINPTPPTKASAASALVISVGENPERRNCPSEGTPELPVSRYRPCGTQTPTIALIATHVGTKRRMPR